MENPPTMMQPCILDKFSFLSFHTCSWESSIVGWDPWYTWQHKLAKCSPGGCFRDYVWNLVLVVYSVFISMTMKAPYTQWDHVGIWKWGCSPLQMSAKYCKLDQTFVFFIELEIYTLLHWPHFIIHHVDLVNSCNTIQALTRAFP